jgi:hypothetical protein
MIERATNGRPAAVWAGDSGRFGGPDTDEKLHAVLAEVERACVRPEAADGLALKSMASGVPVAEIARRAGVIDVEAAAIRDLRAQVERDKARAARDRARTERFVAEHRSGVR